MICGNLRTLIKALHVFSKTNTIIRVIARRVFFLRLRDCLSSNLDTVPLTRTLWTIAGLHKHCKRRVCFIGFYLSDFRSIYKELVLIPIVGQWLAASKTFLETLTICRTPISALGDAMEARTPIDDVKGRFPILLEDGTVCFMPESNWLLSQCVCYHQEAILMFTQH